MNSIIQKLYGMTGGSLDGKNVDGQTVSASGGGKQLDTPYYGSFQYYRDQANGVGPPPADQGGPTALQIMEHEGMIGEGGMLKSNPNVHSIVAAMYGGGPAEIQSTTNQMNPDWNAPKSYSTVGGIGNTDAWGNKIYWSPPLGKQLTEGEPFTTPAGTYTVSKNPWGQYVLVPEGDAIRGAGPYVTNIHAGEHHVGINPQTGEVWYQKAAGFTNFSGGGDSYTQVEGSPPAPNDPNNGGGNNGGNNGGNSGKSWLEVLGDRDLSSQFPEDSPWRGAERKALSRENSEGARQGLFAGLKESDYYKRLLESLGVV